MPAVRGVPPLRGKCNPPTVPRQGRTIAFAIVREPASLRTGRALTGAVRWILLWGRGEHPKSRQRAAAFVSMGGAVRTLSQGLGQSNFVEICLKLR